MRRDEIAPKEMARRRRCTVKYVYDLLAAARIPGARKIGRRWVIPADAVNSLMRMRPLNSAAVGGTHARQIKRKDPKGAPTL